MSNHDWSELSLNLRSCPWRHFFDCRASSVDLTLLQLCCFFLLPYFEVNYSNEILMPRRLDFFLLCFTVQAPWLCDTAQCLAHFCGIYLAVSLCNAPRQGLTKENVRLQYLHLAATFIQNYFLCNNFISSSYLALQDYKFQSYSWTLPKNMSSVSLSNVC